MYIVRWISRYSSIVGKTIICPTKYLTQNIDTVRGVRIAQSLDDLDFGLLSNRLAVQAHSLGYSTLLRAKSATEYDGDLVNFTSFISQATESNLRILTFLLAALLASLPTHPI